MSKDRPRLTPAAKKVLEGAVKPNRRKTQVTARQVLAQLVTLEAPDPSAVLLGALGVNASEIRRRLEEAHPTADFRRRARARTMGRVGWRSLAADQSSVTHAPFALPDSCSDSQGSESRCGGLGLVVGEDAYGSGWRCDVD